MAGESHGICARHRVNMLAELRALERQMVRRPEPERRELGLRPRRQPILNERARLRCLALAILAGAVVLGVMVGQMAAFWIR
jgi:hypothetical protein